MEQKPQSSNGTQPPLTDQQKAELAGLAQMLGIPQIAEQVTKLTEVTNALMTGGKPISTTQAAGAIGGFDLKEIARQIVPEIPKIVATVIDRIMGGGEGQQMEGPDKQLWNETLQAAKEKEIALKDCVKLMAEEIRAGKTVVRNPETGDLVITTRQPQKSGQ